MGLGYLVLPLFTTDVDDAYTFFPDLYDVDVKMIPGA